MGSVVKHNMLKYAKVKKDKDKTERTIKIREKKKWRMRNMVTRWALWCDKYRAKETQCLLITRNVFSV